MSIEEPRWDIDFRHGHQGELWVSSIREALAHDSIEVKTERAAMRTGNIFIEYECLKRGKYTPSGIATTSAIIYVFVLIQEELLLAITTEKLKQIAGMFYKNPMNRKECMRGSHPTKGVIIPVCKLIETCLAPKSVLSNPVKLDKVW